MFAYSLLPSFHTVSPTARVCSNLRQTLASVVEKERSAPHICTDNDKSETENQPCSTGYQPYCLDNKLGEP